MQEVPMTDWADGIEGRNWGIKRRTDSRHLRDLLLGLLPVLVLAGVPFFHSWVRSRIVDMGYQVQRLRVEEETLLLKEKAYILEEATLKSPQRIDEIARTDLGMMPIQPNQLITSQVRDLQQDGATIIAMAAATSASVEPRKP
jgi:cell division protein FtsL